MSRLARKETIKSWKDVEKLNMVMPVVSQILMVIRRILRPIHSLFCYFFGLAMILFYGLIILRICILLTGDKRKFAHIGEIQWGRTILWLARVKLVVLGLQNLVPGRNYIIVSNHNSLLDFVIIFAAMPFKFAFIMDKELFKIPIFGNWAHFAGYLSINRRNPMKALADLRKIIAKIKQGESVVIFGEGTRSRDGKLHPFKSGVGVLAHETGVPVIPVAIDGDFSLLPAGTIVHNPGTVYISFGEPQIFKPSMSPAEIVEKLHGKVAEVLEALRAEKKNPN